jgi:hypothetical protein
VERRERSGTGCFGTLDFIEAVFYVLGGLVVLGIGVVRTHDVALRVGGRPLVAGLIAGLTVVVCVVARDAARRRWSPVSVAVAVVYAACIGVVFWWELHAT